MSNKFVVQVGNERMRLLLFTANGARSSGVFAVTEMENLRRQIATALRTHSAMSEAERLDSEELYEFPKDL